jgi:hypothetical protein
VIPRSWKRAEGALWRQLLSDVVVVAADGDAEPFAISGGARLWDLLEEPRQLDELAAALGGSAAKEELASLLASLVTGGVIDRVDS